MSHESTLNHIHSTINQKLADVESRIERVKTAKKEIEKEHETGIVTDAETVQITLSR